MWETRRTRGDLIQQFKDTTNQTGKSRRNKLGSQAGRITSSRRAQEPFRKGTN